MTQQAFSNYQDYYTHGPHTPCLQTLQVAGQTPVTFLTMDQPAGQFPDPPMPEFALQLVTAGVIQTEVCFGGDRFRRTFVPGEFVLAPANVETDYLIDSPVSLLVLAFPQEPYTRFLAQTEIPLSRDFGALHRGAFRDPFVQHLVQRMYQEATCQSLAGELFVDTALTTLIAALVAKSATGKGVAEKSYTLGTDALKTVLDGIEAQLSETLNLANLAAVAGLSDWHFARAFKTAMGQPPHQYVLGRRIERARQLLERGKLPLAEVAYTCGFASQSHMTDVFRKKLGVTPGRYRKEVRK